MASKKSYFVIFGLTFCVHIFIAIQLKMLHLSADEFCVLAEASFLSGENWSGLVKNSSYYGYGQALLYVPLFLLFSNPTIRYIGCGIINSVILAIIPIIVFDIQRRFLSFSGKKAALFSLMIGLFPAYTAFTKWIYNETLLAVLPWILLYCLLFLYVEEDVKRKKIESVILAALLVWGYATHGRAIAFIITVFIIIAIIALQERKMLVNIKVFLIAFIVFFLFEEGIRHFFYDHLWMVENGESLNNTLKGNASNLIVFFSPQYWGGTLRILVGQFFAAVSATYGLLIAFIVVISLEIKECLKNGKERIFGVDSRKFIYLYAGILFLVAFGISVVFLCPEGSDTSSRGDYYIYTRYFSNTLGIVLFAILFDLLYRNQYIRIKYQWIIGFFFIMALSPLISKWVNSRDHISNGTIINLLPYLGNNPIDYIDFANFKLLVLSISLVFVIINIFFTCKKNYFINFLLIVIFLHAYLYAGYHVFIPNSEKNYQQVRVMQETIQNLNLEGTVKNIYYYDKSNIKAWSDSKMQFALPKYTLKNISGSDIKNISNSIENDSLIIATEDLFLEQYNDSFFRIYDVELNKNNEYLWGYGNELKIYLEDMGVSIDRSDIRYLDLNLFSSSIGDVSDESIKNVEETGYLMFGPYITLLPGEYEVVLQGRRSSFGGEAYMDIVGEAGEQMILSKELIGGDDENFAVKKKFEVLNEIDDLEIRVFLRNYGIMQIEKVYIKKCN